MPQNSPFKFGIMPLIHYLTLVGTTKYGNRCNSLNISLL